MEINGPWGNRRTQGREGQLAVLAECRRGESWRNHPRAASHYVPASRAKLTMLNTVSKIRGQVKSPGYPQSEGLLGECMIRYGKELGGESNFGEGGEKAGPRQGGGRRPG